MTSTKSETAVSRDPWGEGRRMMSEFRAILARPDVSPDELFEIHARVYRLLENISFTRSDAMIGWLLEVRQEIRTRLGAWVQQELEAPNC